MWRRGWASAPRQRRGVDGRWAGGDARPAFIRHEGPMTVREPVDNPLRAGMRSPRTPEPGTLVIFGATGDLTQRKLIPALYNLALEGLLLGEFSAVGFARRPPPPLRPPPPPQLLRRDRPAPGRGGSGPR